MSPITTHVLDVSRGRPAAGVPVVLEVLEDGAWRELSRGATDAEGRCRDLLASGASVDRARYRFTFDTASYFAASKTETFYPHVTVVFEITNPAEHHHVPLLLSPFGYSTYRGS